MEKSAYHSACRCGMGCAGRHSPCLRQITKRGGLWIHKTKKLYRVRDGIIAGVCGGLADFFGLDPSLIRIATLILILFGGLSLWVYIILWLIVPKAPKRLTE